MQQGLGGDLPTDPRLTAGDDSDLNWQIGRIRGVEVLVGDDSSHVIGWYVGTAEKGLKSFILHFPY